MMNCKPDQAATGFSLLLKKEGEAGKELLRMELLLFGPAHLHQRADLDGRFSDGYFAAQDR